MAAHEPAGGGRGGGPDPPRPTPTQEAQMATGEAGFDNVSFDLISAQYHSLKAGHD